MGHTLALPLIPLVLASALVLSHGSLLARSSTSCEFSSGGSAKSCQAVATSCASVIYLEDSHKKLLPQFVKTAHHNHVAAILSVGGWTGSQYFSTAMGSAANRTAFVHAVLSLVKTYDLDGIDFDWEYPGKQGIGCNTILLNDSANFLSFLQELRLHPAGKNIILSATVYITPFAGTDGNPMTDVSAFAKLYRDHGL
jgi:chitinase